MAISDDGMSSVESVGFGSQIGDSLKGILTGLVLFPVSLFLIFKVETCTQASDAFKKARPVSQMVEGQPVYITGKVSASPIGGMFVKPGNYIRISHSSQVYAWDEEVREEGSGSNKKKIRECKLEWTSNPKRPSSFQLPACKNKPYYDNKVESKVYNANGGKLASVEGKTYNIDIDSTDFTSDVKSREPEESELILNGLTKSGNYLYSNSKCINAEIEGCERVTVSVTPIPTENMTFIGKLTGDTLGKFTYKGEQFMNASIGDFQETLSDIKSDDSSKLWIGRIVCFVLMWASFALMAGPITALLDFIPFVGELGSGVIRFAMGIVAFLITTLTILLVNLWWVLLLVILGFVGFGYYKKKNAVSKPA